MTPAQLETVEEIFHAALDREPDEVGAFLKTACKGDELLRDKVEALMASHQRAGNFIETSVASLATRIVEQQQADLLLGQTIGHYKISKRIGTGGMGEVYLASDITAGRKAALKLLPSRFTGDARRLTQFQQEARTVVGLNHPNILTVYEIGEDDSSHYIASELIEGETLRQHLACGRMGLDEALDVAIQVATALAAAHQAGIVHRDIKPENIMLRPDGYVKVLDFGIAKLAEQEVPATMAEEEAVLLVETSMGPILGTVRYMSPEQARGAPVDKRSDIWSLGVVLYEMVSGQAPFTGDTPGEVMASILGTEPPLLSFIAQIPAELRQIVSKALSKERERRYQSAHEMLEALKSFRRGMEFKAELERSTAAPLWRRWARSPTVLVLVLLVAALALTLPFYWRRNLTTGSIPEKSIAVLPFENLGDNKENSDFGAGIQDDVLTSLAQIHDLKVISRTSVMVYQKRGGRNMRAIGRELGVANILEGSVRREGNRVLVNVQLIDAQTDQHLWAQRYDRTVAGSIGLQGELATQIAAALKATLAPEEKARLDAGPTTNSEAYVLYLTALGKEATDEIAAEQLYVQATALDPKFALAHARASLLNNRFASYYADRARKAKARAQAEEAIRLSPTLGEAHMALGLCLYWGEKNYDAALKEFERAAAASPNNAETYTYVAGIYRRQGRWREAVASFDRALSLDPRNARIVFVAANNHLFMREWPKAAAGFTRTLEIAPDDPDPKVALAYLEVVRNNNPVAGTRLLQSIPPAIDPDGMVTEARWDLAMLERDYSRAEKILSEYRGETLLVRPKAFYQGRTARARGETESTQRYLATATPFFEGRVRDDPADPNHHAQLGLLYAYMQRKEDAIRESRRAVELEPESQNAFHGALRAANLALVYALMGEEDHAMTLIERLLSTPGPVSWPDSPQSITLADLRLRWEWDSLRSNPRFQKILAAPEPKTNLTSIASAAPAAPEKSIAVLPFENLSDDKQNSYFAAGIQDDVLTSLAQIHALKVIGRTSVMQYKSGIARNLKEIAQQLGVSKVVEGSVRRSGNHVRVSVQLIDALTDRHIWAENYDRTLADSLALQGELATEIAASVGATLTPQEKARVQAEPTNNADAYDAYLRGRAITILAMSERANLDRAVRSYEEAVKLDPNFALAWLYLSRTQSIYYRNWPSPARLAAAKDALDRALALDPNLPEAHLARGYYRFQVERDCSGALSEFQKAEQGLPNNADVFTAISMIQRRRGRSDEAIEAARRAVALDPRNRDACFFLATTYGSQRRFRESRAVVDRVLAFDPTDRPALNGKVYGYLLTGDLKAAEPLLADPNIEPGAHGLYAFLQRNYAAAAETFSRTTADDANRDWTEVFALGICQQRTGNVAAARETFQGAIQGIQRELAQAQPDPLVQAALHGLLGVAHALLGEAAPATSEGEKAISLKSTSEDLFDGPPIEETVAQIYATLGDADHAVPILQRLLQMPYRNPITTGRLQVDPFWDPIRNDSRFQELAAEKPR